MNTVTRLTLYVAGLVLVFGVMFFAGRALVPDDTVATWTREANASSDEHSEMGSESSGAHGQEVEASSHVRGLAIDQNGYRLSPVTAPERAGRPGELSFKVIGPDGAPFTNFVVNHEKPLHLIVVRSDGAAFRHVHPRLDVETGLWSTPWEWPRGGNYRVFADFVPGGSGEQGDVTLARSVAVAGDEGPRSIGRARRWGPRNMSRQTFVAMR